jgi:hypothetical protein
MKNQPIPHRTPLVTDDFQARRNRSRHGEKLGNGWAEADLLALALWLRDGGPANRLEQYRHEVLLQLEASDVALHEERQANVASARESPRRSPRAMTSPQCAPVRA